VVGSGWREAGSGELYTLANLEESEQESWRLGAGWELGALHSCQLRGERAAELAGGGRLGAGSYTLANLEESEQESWREAGGWELHTPANLEESEQESWREAGGWELGAGGSTLLLTLRRGGSPAGGGELAGGGRLGLASLHSCRL
jgi:hypothetical protein